MQNRRASFVMIAALALLVSAPSFASEAPAAPVSETEFLASLQVPEAPEQPALDEVRTEQAPIFKHGYNCTYIGTRVCIPCSAGKAMNCDDYRCYYAGQWHTDSICGSCNNFC